MRSKRSRLLASGLFAVACLLSASAVSASDSLTALLNTPLTVTGPDSMCRIVTNASPTGKTVYVPTNSIPEWQSFVAHPPAGVTLLACGPVCTQALSPLATYPQPSGASSIVANTAGVFAWGGDAFHGLKYDGHGWQYYGGLYYDSGSMLGTQGAADGDYAFMSMEETGWVWNPSYVRAYKIQDGSLVELPALVLGGGIGTGVGVAGNAVFVASGISGGGGPGYLYAYRFDGNWHSIASYYLDQAGWNVWSFDGQVVYVSGWSGGLSAYWFDGASFTSIGGLATMSAFGQLAGYGHYVFDPVTNGLIAYTVTATGVEQLGSYSWPDGLHSGSVTVDATTGTVYLTGYNDTQTRLVALSFDGHSLTLKSAQQGVSSYFGSLAVDKNYLYMSTNAGITAYPHLCLISGPMPQCSDSVDNDGNGVADMADTCGCSSSSDLLEASDGVLCPLPAPTPPAYTTVICTELNRQGLLPDKWMLADQRFGASMPAVVMNGYHFWARPLVRLMQQSHTVTTAVNFFAQPWAQEMAHLEGVEPEGSFAGAFVMVVGIPLSALFGVLFTPWW